MAARRTRVVLSIPWDDEDRDHPISWGFDVLLSVGEDEQGVGVIVVDFEEVTPAP